MDVPPVLMSGDHSAVDRWRTEQAKILTAKKHQLTNHPTSAPPSNGASEGN